MPNTCFCAPCVKYFSMRPVWWSSLLQQHCMGWRKDVSISDKNLCYKIPRVKWFGWPDAQGIIDGSGCLLQRTPFVCFASPNHKFFGKGYMHVSHPYQVPTVKLTTIIFSGASNALPYNGGENGRRQLLPWHSCNHQSCWASNNQFLQRPSLYYLIFSFLFLHVIFLVTVNNRYIGLLSYILQAESLGRLSSYSRISPLVVPHISHGYFWLWLFLNHLFGHTVLVGPCDPI